MPSRRVIEIEADFVIESPFDDGVVQATVRTVKSPSGATIVLDIDRLPPRGATRGLTRMVWRSRRTLAANLVRSAQSFQLKAFQLNVSGRALLHIVPTPSRLGSLIGTPGLRLRFAAGSWLAERFNRR